MLRWSVYFTVMSRPEELFDEEGKWARRDVFLEEFVEEHSEEKANTAVDELIENGTMRQKVVGGKKYVQLVSRKAAYKQLIKGKVKGTKNKAIRLMNK